MNNNRNQNKSKLAQLDYQDLPEVALMKNAFPFCKSAKVGNLLYPVIANDNLMHFIAFEENLVAAARKVKLNAVNPSGSEHGIVKKVCDMFIKHPSFGNIICQDLMQGIYASERIASDPVFKAKYKTFPRGFKYTVNQMIQTMIMNLVDVSLVGDCLMAFTWNETRNPGVSAMFDDVDQILAKAPKYWVSFRLKSFPDRIPHDRLAQKIRIMFQTAGIVVCVCSNLAFGGTTVVRRKHTSRIDLSELIDRAVASLEDDFLTEETVCENLKDAYLRDDDEARSCLVRAAELGVINSSDILPVYQEFKSPSHVEFAEPTRWSLLNALSETVKKYSPQRVDYSYRALNRAFGLDGRPAALFAA